MGFRMVCNMERWTNKASTQRLFGGIMKVGDLVFDTEAEEMTIVIAILDGGVKLKSLVCGEEFEVWDGELIEVIK